MFSGAFILLVKRMNYIKVEKLGGYEICVAGFWEGDLFATHPHILEQPRKSSSLIGLTRLIACQRHVFKYSLGSSKWKTEPQMTSNKKNELLDSFKKEYLRA